MISYYGNLEEQPNIACYYGENELGGQGVTVSGYHESSCQGAKDAAADIIDPTGLRNIPSNIPPAGHNQAQLYCDFEYCRYYHGRFNVKCRLLRRGITFKCNYYCDPPSP